jgi:hypothetical protein
MIYEPAKFGFSGISFSLDLAIVLAVIVFIYSARKDRAERVAREKSSNLATISKSYEELNELINDLFSALKEKNLEAQVSTHDKIWKFLGILELKSALMATPKFHRQLVKCKKRYKNAMHGMANPLLGLKVLAYFVGSMIQEMQNEEVANEYLIERFDMSMESLRESLKSSRLSID